MDQTAPKPRKPNRIERIKEAQGIELHPERNLMGVLANTEPFALAYLWIAIELNYNLVVFHICKDAKAIISALSMFVPRYHTVVDISGDKVVDSRVNFTKLITTGSEDGVLALLDLSKIPAWVRAGTTRRLIDSVMPDRIIGPKDSLGLLFSGSKYGISFIASVSGDFYNRSIVKALRSRRFGIDPSDINAIDISIMLDGNSHICSITEYMWLERAEIKVIEKGFVPRSINNISIMSGGRFNRDSIGNSKLIEAYAKSNFISKDYALNELERRKDFLERAAISGNAKTDFIERYHEIV